MPWAVMEFVLVMGLGLSMMDIRLEKKPSLGVLMEGNILLNEWAEIGRSSCRERV